jgi:hypothetical protein
VTELDLTAIKKRSEAATRGPWSVGVGWEDAREALLYWLPVNSPGTNGEDPHQPDRVTLIRYFTNGFQFPHADARADAEFIAASRTDVPALVAEVERLTRLLGPAEVPSVDAYENVVQALSDERAEVVRHCDRIAELAALLAEILRYFPGPFRDTVVGVRSTFVSAETLDRWRSHLERAS